MKYIGHGLPSVALARTYPGGVEAFVAQMARKAAEMGMGHSHFAEPIGCMAMLTRIRGEPLVLVLLDAGSLGTRSQDARKLRQWAGQQAGSRRATSARASSPR